MSGLSRKSWGLFVAAALAGAPALAQTLANRPFVTSADKSTARFVGPRCGDSVDFVLSAGQPQTFNRDRVATRLMGNVVEQLRLTCPRVKLVSAKGMVGEQIVYNAVAEAATGWELLELGSARSAGLLTGGAAGASGDKAAFARRRDFSPFAGLAPAVRAKPFLCSEAMGASCVAITELRNATPAGALVVARHLVDARGSQAVLTYQAQARDGFLCADPQIAKIEVIGNAAGAEARARLAADLRERLKPFGNEVCVGYASRASGLVAANFRGNGARVGVEAILTQSAAAPTLRKGE